MNDTRTAPITRDWTMTCDEPRTDGVASARVASGTDLPEEIDTIGGIEIAGSAIGGSEIAGSATASDVNRLLAERSVADIGPSLVPYMAAAAAELALIVGVAWRFSADDPPVALLRMIAKAAIRRPDAGGPHTARLLDALR